MRKESGVEVQLKELRPAAQALKLKLEEIETQLDPKGLESALKEVIPGMSRVGVLWDAAASGLGFKEYEAAVHALKIQLHSLEVRGPNPDLEGAFQAAAKGRANALITVRGTAHNRYLKRIAELAINNRLPSMSDTVIWVEAGGLMSYAANDVDSFRRAAVYVDKILKGTKPPTCRSSSRRSLSL